MNAGNVGGTVGPLFAPAGRGTRLANTLNYTLIGMIIAEPPQW